MMAPIDGVRLSVVVDRYEAVYSGMVPGLVAGDYSADQPVIDVLPLARRANARCLHAAAVRIDPGERVIELSGRPPIAYDVASLDVGSSVRDLDAPGVREHAVATRPIARFVEEIDRRLSQDDLPERPRVVVVGGGAAGVELALCLEARLRAAGRTAAVTLLAASDTLLPGAQRHLVRRILAEAARRDVTIACGQRVVGVEPDAVLVEAQGAAVARVTSDLTLWATGPAPPPLLGASKLPLTSEGFVRVDEKLRVVGYEDLFAVGDCAVSDASPWVPRAGVYAVRQGPVLDANLRAHCGGRALRRYRPQRDFLALLNLGEGRAAGGKWQLGAAGRQLHRLKERIDRRFMRRFQVLDASGRPSKHFPPADSMATEAEMLCGGCAAKVGPSPLRAALSRLPTPPADPSVRSGLASADDAAALELPGGDLVLASVDAFRAFTDDPWLVGRTAAVNAVSDVFAKGGRPRHALAIVSVPEGTPGQQSETLHQVLAGVRAALDPLEVSLVGGHSTTGPELFVGLSITGEPLREGQILGLDGLRAGDRLVLSKPLGSGVLLAADMRGLARGAWIEALHEGLLRDTRDAADAALEHAARACTDVSGFGLAGHLLEMLDASRVDARLDPAALPAYPGALALMRDGLRSTYHDQNATLRARVNARPGADPSALELLFDPQTSGGLLIGAPAERAEALTAALHRAGDHAAAIVGEVVESDAGASAITLG